MYKKTVTYEDYNGITKTEDFYFNLTEVELTGMELETEGGMSGMLNEAVNSKDPAKLIDVFKKIMLKAYGVRTQDGRFKKNQELLDDFTSSAAYSKIFMELISDDKAAAEFVNGVIPKDLADRANAEMAKGNLGIVPPINE